MTNGQRVLVVDGLAETEEVLKAVLEPQGLEVNRIRTHFAPTAPAAEPPHLVILHEESHVTSSDSSDSWKDIPRVVIGSASLPKTASPQPCHREREQYLAQPFQYRDLIQAVVHLLAE